MTFSGDMPANQRLPVNEVAVASSRPDTQPRPLSADALDIDWVRRQYELGRKYSGTLAANPWKRDTAEFLAWDHGYRNLPFESSAELKPATEKPEPQRTSGSLFE